MSGYFLYDRKQRICILCCIPFLAILGDKLSDRHPVILELTHKAQSEMPYEKHGIDYGKTEYERNDRREQSLLYASYLHMPVIVC
jgi:hypothetical protein